MTKDTGTSPSEPREAYRHALRLLHDCNSPVGFLASPVTNHNYRRVWARDGAIISLAALSTEDPELLGGCRQTLETLLQYQGPHGEIPSNVDPDSGRVSYGGTAGRVDADLWFVIACGEYWQATGDDDWMRHIASSLERIRFLLGAWEFNNRGLIYVPQTGDWADEYLQSGYVLYDQLLYLQAQRVLLRLHEFMHQGSDHVFAERVVHLKHLIQSNFWLGDQDHSGDDIYHEVLYEKSRKAKKYCHGRYWLPFFQPTGYGYRFDAFANVLVSLLDVADAAHCKAVDAYIDEIVNEELLLLPAFHPVIRPPDDDWEDLSMTFSYTFKNRPYEYHNGGLWPLLTGFYVADLKRRGLEERAGRFTQALSRANALDMDGEAWSFPEYVNGKTLEAGGTCRQGWSAAAQVIAEHARQGKPLFRIDGNQE
jgi:glycogen debranching enzyme